MADLSIKRMEQTEQSVAELKGSLMELTRKSERAAGGFRDEPTTWGQQFVQADGLKTFSDETNRPARFRLDVKANTNDAANAGTTGVSTGDAVALLPCRRMTVRELLPTVDASTNLVEFITQQTRPGNAATVAESAAKPEAVRPWHCALCRRSSLHI